MSKIPFYLKKENKNKPIARPRQTPANAETVRANFAFQQFLEQRRREQALGLTGGALPRRPQPQTTIRGHPVATAGKSSGFKWTPVDPRMSRAAQEAHVLGIQIRLQIELF